MGGPIFPYIWEDCRSFEGFVLEPEDVSIAETLAFVPRQRARGQRLCTREGPMWAMQDPTTVSTDQKAERPGSLILLPAGAFVDYYVTFRFAMINRAAGSLCA